MPKAGRRGRERGCSWVWSFPWGDEEVLELDRVRGCTARGLCQLPLNCTFQKWRLSHYANFPSVFKEERKSRVLWPCFLHPKPYQCPLFLGGPGGPSCPLPCMPRARTSIFPLLPRAAHRAQDPSGSFHTLTGIPAKARKTGPTTVPKFPFIRDFTQPFFPAQSQARLSLRAPRLPWTPGPRAPPR